MTHSKTAILIFAQSAQQEQVAKPFSESGTLFGQLNKQTLSKVKKTKLPFFHFSEKEQVGNTFGERYVNAIQAVFNKGFKNIITIGNDTPHLQTRHIVETNKKLQNNPVVLGPSKDGGYYLMGLQKTHFDASLFLKFPWQTRALNQSFATAFENKNTKVTWLEVLTDIDSVSDIRHILDSFKVLSISLKKLLYKLVQSEKVLTQFTSIFFQRLSTQTPFNKGSPFLAS